jgi:signal transduction histidine kinase/DNA-binding response OmpR family regulator
MSTVSDAAKILIVDDLPEKVLVLETILSELEGVQILTARSGETALQLILENDFAVILLDVNMPGMDGFETASFIRSRKRSAHTPIIFVTAFADEVLASRGYSLGAVDYILSPVVPGVLRSKVSVFIDLFRLTQQVRRQGEQQVHLAREQAARAAAENASQRANFLAEASRKLAASLDPEVTWQSLGRLAVPTLAEFCGVSRVDADGRVTTTELIWCDSDGDMHSLQVAEPADLGRAYGDCIGQVLESGHVETVPFGGDSWPPGACGEVSPNSRRMEPGTSLVSIPIRVAERTLGIVTLALSSESESEFDIALARDLAARAASAIENAGLYESIREAGRRKDEFLAMLAHELRNPLAPIRYAVEIFRMVGLSDAALEQPLDMIDRQVTHMSRLIDELLDFSRLTRGKILLKREPIDLNDIVSQAADDIRATIEENQLSLDVQLPDAPIIVQGDSTRLAQIVSNVLQNATKFTDPGGSVSIELRAESSDLAAITIRDTGIGMEPAMLERAFDTFSQADRSLDRSRGGLGLGLALVKQLVNLHGGTVSVSSAGLGQGTEVTIQLPCSLEAIERGSGLPAEAPIPDARSLKVMIIEDNPDTAQSLRIVMSLSGHQVAVAYDGMRGLEVAREFGPDVVLCDIGLPGEFDGYAVAESIRREYGPASAYLIATTGYGQDQDRRRSRSAGFDAHLTKPVDPAELQHLLAKVSSRLVAN